MSGLRWARIVFVAGTLSSVAVVQSSTATLVGTVRDSSGAVLAGVSIQIRNSSTDEHRETVTTATGDFTVAELPPGIYEVIARKQGFRALRETDFELQIDQMARLDLKMELGAVSESVEVMAYAPLLNTENAVKGDVLVSSQVIEMPLNGRDFSDLALLVPSVLPRAQGGLGSAFNINGARADNTNFVIDGFNDQNPRGAAAQARPNLDALEEFKMQTSNYSAETGRLAGGVMNMVLKSGSNRFHGVLFEFIRNNIFDARNFFDADQAPLHRNQFGGTVSGPVIVPRIYNGHDRTFFLFSWESYRQTQGDSLLSHLPSAAERSGDFSADGPLKDPLKTGTCSAAIRTACFLNVIPPDRLSPIALRVQKFYPTPNVFAGANNYRASVIAPDDWDAFVIKVDQHFLHNDTVSYRFLDRRNRNANPFNGSDTGQYGNRVRQGQSLMGLNYVHLFRSNLLNDARVGFSRTDDREVGYFQGHDYAADFGIPGLTTDPKLIGIPRFTVQGFAALGDGANMPVSFDVNNLEGSDALTWVKGSHIFKTGVDILRTQFFQPYYNNNRGTFNFIGRWTTQPYADFLLGLPDSTSRQIGVTNNYLFSTFYGVFVQDDWKIRPNLTLNVGLRWDIPKPPVDKYDRWTNFVPAIGRQILADDRTLVGSGIVYLQANTGLARDYGLPPALVYARYNNLAPRFGLAWRPFGGTRLVVRGGFGIFYGTALQNPVRNDLANVFPFATSQTFNRLANNINFITLANPFPPGGATINVNGYDLHAKTPSLESWNLTLEREIGNGTAIEIAYVGSKGSHLGRQYDLNQPFRIPGLQFGNGNFPRPFNDFGTINYYGFGSNSSYNAGTLSLRRALRNGFFYTLNYTYSKSIDDASQIQGNSDGGYALAQNSRDLRADRGRSDFDIGHAFTSLFSYETPWKRNILVRGWQVSGTTRMYTGQPFTPKVTNVNLNLGEANRPDRVAKGTLPAPGADQWFDVTAFPAVPTGSFRFGNSGRNILDAPGRIELNGTLFKNFRREKWSSQFRWEVFNVLNHPNFHLPVNAVNAPNAATITAADPGRLMQFGLRVMF